MSNVTLLLRRLDDGDGAAAAELAPIVYDELRRLAARQLSREPGGVTLNATALVHEVYLKLVAPHGAEPAWSSRGHFFGAAARAMRQVLVDAARARRAEKRGGGRAHVNIDLNGVPDRRRDADVEALDEALHRLEAEQPELARLVNLRYFAGLTMPEAAEVLGVSLRTAERSWAYARAWLLRELASINERDTAARP